MDDLILINPSIDYAKEIKRYRDEFIEHGGDMDGCLSLKRMENPSDWIDQVEKFKTRETCPSQYVPVCQYICLRKSDNKLVGMIQIRPELNDYCEKYSGHIAYSVCPSERKKGYATFMLNRVLGICKEKGLKKVLVTSKDDNEASKKVIKKCGGIYESTVREENENVNLERYFIYLSSR